MGDTSRGFWPKENCSDCGEVGVVFLKHWGPLVPADAIGFFCVFCWNEREKDCKEGKEPKLLGVKPLIEECFTDKEIKATTKTSIYLFGKPTEKENIRTVEKVNNGLPFNLCRIICLKEKKPIYLIPVDSDKWLYWITSPVLKIE